MSQTTLDGGYALDPKSNGAGNPRSATRYVLDVARHSSDWKDAGWQGFKLPGWGRRLITCGAMGLHVCMETEKHQGGRPYVMPYLKQCRRSQCPACVESWANNEANSVTTRALQFADTMRQGSIVNVDTVFTKVGKVKLRELANRIKWDIGVTKRPETRKGLRRWNTTDLGSHLRFFTSDYVMRSKLHEVSCRYGVRVTADVTSNKMRASHVSVSFPESMYDDKPEDLMKLVKSVMFRTGIIGAVMVWHPFRFDKADGWKPSVSPHVHMVAFGWVDDVHQAFEEYGLVVRKHTTLKTDGDYFATVKYILTHAGVRDRRHSVTYWGALSYSKLTVYREAPEPERCPHCEGILVDGKIPDDKMPYLTGIPPPFEINEGTLTDYPVEASTFYDRCFYRIGTWDVITMDDAKIDRLEARLEDVTLAKPHRDYLQSRLDMLLEKRIGKLGIGDYKPDDADGGLNLNSFI